MASVTGIAWYKKEDYEKLLSLFIDRGDMASTYQEWLISSESLVDQLRQSGNAFQKVYIDPATFPAWCAARRMNINAEARARFVAIFECEPSCLLSPGDTPAMQVYRAECAEILRRFREHRINHQKCTASLDAAVAEAVLRLSPEELPELRAAIMENSRIVKEERTRRRAAQAVTLPEMRKEKGW
jgi:hypothetical protein